jgi:hypothetical protein
MSEPPEIFEGAEPEGMEHLQDDLEEQNDLEDAENLSVYADEYAISDAPELIAEIPVPPQSASTTTIADPDIPVESHLTSTVCDVCLELNLTTHSCIKCQRCEQAFCLHFASAVDAVYCVNCMSDISVTKQIITKEYVHRDDERGVTSIYRRRAREVKIAGLDWLFAQRRITDLSDMELDLAIEYHRNILSLMISEQESRRNVKMHRYAGVKVSIPTPATTTVSNTSTTTTTTKKTRVVSKTKQQEQLAALLKSITAKGTSIDQIAAMLKKGTGAGK